LSANEKNVWNEKNIINEEFLIKYANDFLNICKDVPGVKKNISEKQIKLLMQLFDDDSKK
jgi:hypothetical protein